MQSNKIYLLSSTLTFIFLFLLSTIVSAQTPPPEDGCRLCHGNTTDMHHDRYNNIIPTPTDAPYGTPGDVYGCLSCHEEQTSCGGTTLIIVTDCAACHVAADPHHTPAPSTCLSCHSVDRPADPHPQSSDCAFCHNDPGGSWPYSTFDHTPDTQSCTLCHESERPADPHAQTGDCSECHIDAGNSWLAIYDHLPVPTLCRSCHETDRPADPHPQNLDCTYCHKNPGNSWLLGAWDHIPTPTSCTACHVDNRPAEPHPQISDCSECHIDVNSWLYDHTPTPTTCNLCHAVDRPADPHPQILDCNFCHNAPGVSWLGTN